jgi:hypothetical protein
MHTKVLRGFWLSLVFLGLFIIPFLPWNQESIAASAVKLEVLDPRGELFTPPFTPISARLSTLAGKKIGILRNTKPGADSFAPFLEKALKEVAPNIQFRTWVIPYNVYPNKDKDLKALFEWGDAVIGMMGD